MAGRQDTPGQSIVTEPTVAQWALAVEVLGNALRDESPQGLTLTEIVDTWRPLFGPPVTTEHIEALRLVEEYLAEHGPMFT